MKLTGPVKSRDNVFTGVLERNVPSRSHMVQIYGRHPVRQFSQPTLLHPQRRDYFSGVSFAPFSTFSLKLVTIESTII